ncbi:hypothetical protein ACNKHU_12550 [Shigella flexneri]
MFNNILVVVPAIFAVPRRRTLTERHHPELKVESAGLGALVVRR